MGVVKIWNDWFDTKLNFGQLKLSCLDAKIFNLSWMDLTVG